MKVRKHFASDNTSMVHEKIMQAMLEANRGQVISYGEDVYTEHAIRKIKEVLGQDIDVYFVYNGTGANVTGLAAATHSYHAVLCAETAHINEDECGAPEKFAGCKLLPIPTDDGKIRIRQLEKYLHSVGFEHHAQPKVISITQSTELGTLYTVNEIREIADFAHQHDMYLHMDGARIANAAAALNVGLREITGDAGVDILSFGGTKNGMMFGEAVVFFNKTISKDFKYIRKQSTQLASKMRYIAVQFEALLKDDLWLQNARHANAMAKLLEKQVKDIPQIEVMQPAVVNAVFAKVPKEIIPKLQEKYYFYVWDEETSVVRWMTAYDTTEEDVAHFVGEIKKLLA